MRIQSIDAVSITRSLHPQNLHHICYGTDHDGNAEEHGGATTESPTKRQRKALREKTSMDLV
ncbi:hypothetical protein GJ744_009202 [Endocarpon pusillum]|uniref:Uncharacterized protein n=1 Tax=Endocarpon pusillum TaxID=364733 RepID=A0A8H7AJD0_9EURO|nr:hypothetical protein GJ744_009202 [Endocarpon pusillum]